MGEGPPDKLYNILDFYLINWISLEVKPGLDCIKSRLEFKLYAQDGQKSPLIFIVRIVLERIPKDKGDILAIVGIPDAEEDREVGSAEVEAFIRAQIQGMIGGQPLGIDPVLIEDTTVGLT